MQLDIIVEEPSAEEALGQILPKIVRGRARIKIVNMRSKSNLLKKLPDRLRAYGDRLAKGEDLRVVVLVDRDADDCAQLKAEIERAASAAGLSSKSRPDVNGKFCLVSRIAIEELEAWFIGDTAALRRAFPSIKNSRMNVSNPDNVSRGTWETLHRFLKGHGIYRNCYPKIEAARHISQYMDVTINTSRSFRVFVAGVECLLS